MKSKWHLAWVVPAFIILASGLTVAYFQIQKQRELKSQAVIQVTPALQLRLLTALTAATPEYSLGEKPWVRKLKAQARKMLPAPLKKYVPANRTSYSQKYHGPDATGIKFIFEVDYAGGSGASAYNSVYETLRDNHYHNFQLEFGPGFYSGMSYLGVSQIGSYPASGSSRDHYMGSVDISSVPVNVESFKLQAVDTSDYHNRKVVHEISLPNPLYRKVAPLDKPADTLPVKVTHGNMEVTARGLICQVQKGVPLIGGRDTPISEGEDLVDPGDFPKGDPARGYDSVLVLNVVNTDPAQSTWQVDWPEITYGREAIPFRMSTFGTHGTGNTTAISLPTDLSQLPQPLQISLPLKRADKFPADEEVTIDLPFPKDGEGIDTSATANLWTGPAEILGIARGESTYRPGRGKYHNTPMSNSFTLYLQTKHQTRINQITLTGPKARLEMDGNGSYSASYGEYHTHGYHLGNQVFDRLTRKMVKPTPDEYTTVSVRFRSPRTFPATFEFVMNAERATGEPIPRDQY